MVCLFTYTVGSPTYLLIGNLTFEVNQITTVGLVRTNCSLSLNTSQGPVIEHVYGSLLKLYHKYIDVNLRGRILHCLGA